MLNLVEILFPPVAMVYVIALLLLPFTWMANTARAAELARWLGEVTAEDVMPYFARAGGPRTGQSTGGQ
jgi:hypothetical protein